MNWKKGRILVIVVFAGILMIFGSGKILNYQSKKIYTYEELASLSSEQLLDLFVENGLVINDELKDVFDEEELQALFKTEFDLLRKGITARNDFMYFDLATKTKEIYEKITTK